MAGRGEVEEGEEEELTMEEIDDWACPMSPNPEDVMSESDEQRTGTPPSRGGSSGVGGATGSDSPTAQHLTVVKETEAEQTEAQPPSGEPPKESDGPKFVASVNSPVQNFAEEKAATTVPTEAQPSPSRESKANAVEVMAPPVLAPLTLSDDRPPRQEGVMMSREDVPPTDEPAPESPKMVNWGWGWGAVSGALREVSAGVAKDVAELKESFQAAIRVDSDEEGYTDTDEREAEPVLEKEKPSPPAPELTEEEKRRQEVLARLEGGDSEFQKGVKVIDHQVEHLATGIWGLVGKAGRGVGTFAKKIEVVTKDMASEVALEFKETMQDVKSLPAVQVASSGLASGRKFLATAERQLEHVGQRAMAILEAGLDDNWEEEDGVFRPEDATFDQCFYVAGGQEALEEVEELGNECSRLCNRARRNLSPSKQSAFETQITQFAPLFDLSSELVQSNEGGKSTVPLPEGYMKVEAMRVKAVELASELSAAAVRLSGNGSEDEERNAPATAEQAAAVLRNMKGEGLQQVAETCAAGIRRLLALGHSVGAHLLGQQGDQVWPDGAERKATLLRFVAHQLEGDVGAVSAAFCEALGEADEVLMAPFREGAEEAEETGASSNFTELQAQTVSAVQNLREAFRALMYVVLAAEMTEGEGAVEGERGLGEAEEGGDGEEGKEEAEEGSDGEEELGRIVEAEEGGGCEEEQKGMEGTEDAGDGGESREMGKGQVTGEEERPAIS